MNTEPCLCGDTECPNCNPEIARIAGLEMLLSTYQQALRQIRQIANDGSIPAAIACREIAEFTNYTLADDWYSDGGDA